MPQFSRNLAVLDQLGKYQLLLRNAFTTYLLVLENRRNKFRALYLTILYSSYDEFSYIEHIYQQMHIIKYIKNCKSYNPIYEKYHPYTFRQRNDIFRESKNTKYHKVQHSTPSIQCPVIRNLQFQSCTRRFTEDWPL